MIEYGRDMRLSFDDILLVPQHGSIESRNHVDLSMNIGAGIKLSLPIIASPMDTICEYKMAIAMAKNGGLGIIHRYMDIQDQIENIMKCFKMDIGVGGAVGTNGDYLERAQALVEVGAGLILVDTANGHSELTLKAVRKLKETIFPVHIMAGNVSTSAGYEALSNAGADSIRVGIGGGSCCTTRLVSGHGMPTLASLIEISKRRDQGLGWEPAKIIADGGIRNSGDMVKAFAAGADAVMIGSILAGTTETPGEIFDGYKTFRGMASKEAQEDWRGKSSVSEGVSTTVKHRGPVGPILDEIRGGLGSGCSYSGVGKLEDLQDASSYVRVTSTSLAESRPHMKVNYE